MGHFKKFFLLSAIIVSAICVSCEKGDDSEVNNGNEGNNNEGELVTIQATVNTNGTPVDAVKVFIYKSNGDAYEVANAPYQNGGFTLTLPESVPDQYLTNWNYSGFNASATNVKGISFVWVEAYKGTENVGIFGYGFTSDNMHITTYFSYVNKDVNITGSISEENEGWVHIDTENEFLKKGWNKEYMKKTVSQANKTVEIEYTTTEPSEAHWFFSAY